MKSIKGVVPPELILLVVGVIAIAVSLQFGSYLSKLIAQKTSLATVFFIKQMQIISTLPSLPGDVELRYSFEDCRIEENPFNYTYYVKYSDNLLFYTFVYYAEESELEDFLRDILENYYIYNCRSTGVRVCLKNFFDYIYNKLTEENRDVVVLNTSSFICSLSRGVCKFTLDVNIENKSYSYSNYLIIYNYTIPLIRCGDYYLSNFDIYKVEKNSTLILRANFSKMISGRLEYTKGWIEAYTVHFYEPFYDSNISIYQPKPTLTFFVDTTNTDIFVKRFFDIYAKGIYNGRTVKIEYSLAYTKKENIFPTIDKVFGRIPLVLRLYSSIYRACKSDKFSSFSLFLPWTAFFDIYPSEDRKKLIVEDLKSGGYSEVDLEYIERFCGKFEKKINLIGDYKIYVEIGRKVPKIRKSFDKLLKILAKGEDIVKDKVKEVLDDSYYTYCILYHTGLGQILGTAYIQKLVMAKIKEEIGLDKINQSFNELRDNIDEVIELIDTYYNNITNPEWEIFLSDLNSTLNEIKGQINWTKVNNFCTDVYGKLTEFCTIWGHANQARELLENITSTYKRWENQMSALFNSFLSVFERPMYLNITLFGRKGYIEMNVNVYLK